MDITTQFSPSDIVFVLKYDSKLKQILCKTCEGAGKHIVKNGEEIRCPNCQEGFKKVREKSKYYVNGPFTIGMVRVEIVESVGVAGSFGDNYKPQSKRSESYMFEETGIGSGCVYMLEEGIFGDFKEAQAECDKKNQEKQRNESQGNNRKS